MIIKKPLSKHLNIRRFHIKILVWASLTNQWFRNAFRDLSRTLDK